MDYLSLKQVIEKYQVEKPTLSERSQILKEIYEHYERSYKMNVWSDYIKWLKANKYKHSKEKISEYDKLKFKKITISSFCSFWLSHIPTKDLYYILSYAKDLENRKQNFNKWLFYNLKAK